MLVNVLEIDCGEVGFYFIIYFVFWLFGFGFVFVLVLFFILICLEKSVLCFLMKKGLFMLVFVVVIGVIVGFYY